VSARITQLVDISTVSVAHSLEVLPDASWRVTREGALVAVIGVIQEHGEVVVSAGGGSGPPKPYRFHSLQDADEFVSDLMTSFSYLGCDVAAGDI
jgi:hypothetical protein